MCAAAEAAIREALEPRTCEASIQAAPGSHCIHWEESLDAPCCVCGYLSNDDEDQTPCRPSRIQVGTEPRSNKVGPSSGRGVRGKKAGGDAK